jgi:hypothetical protein
MSDSPVLTMTARVVASGTLFMISVFDVGHAAPVAGEGFELDLQARLLAHELVRAGADRMLAEASSPTWSGSSLGPPGPGGVAVVPKNVMKSGHGSLR